MAQLVASIFGVVLGGVGEVVGLDLAGDEIFAASIGCVDSLYLSEKCICLFGSTVCLFLFLQLPWARRQSVILN